MRRFVAILLLMSCLPSIQYAQWTFSTRDNWIQQHHPQLLSNDWQRQHPIESGWMLFSVSVVDSMHAWACGWHDSAAGLVVRTTDGGENWIEMTRTLPFNLNDIHFVTSSLGWAVGGSGALGQPGYIRRTTDGGQSWASQFSAPNVVFQSVFFLDTLRGWVCGESGKILATTNGGIEWQQQIGGRNMFVNDIYFFPSGVGWAGGGYGPATAFLKTTNFGARWDSISNIRLGRFSFLNDTLGWAVARNSWLYWKTTDGGRTWIQGPYLRNGSVYPTDVVMLSDTLVLSTMWDNRVDPPFDFFPITLQNLTNPFPPIETRTRLLWGIEFVESGHGFAVGLGDIVFSRDRGSTWMSQVAADVLPLYAIDMVDSSTGWTVGEKELILRTTDGGKHWKAQTPARREALQAVASIDEQHAFAGGSAFMSTTNGGSTWTRTALPENYIITGLSFIDLRTGWAAIAATTASQRVLHTTDGGVTWVEQPVSSRVYAIDFVDSNYGWCAGASGFIHATTNGGRTWTVQTFGAVGVFSSIDFVDRTYGWVVAEHLILRTIDGGVHWDTSDVSINAGYRGVRFVNRDTGWVVGSQGRIIVTTNGGSSWITQRTGAIRQRDLFAVDAISSRLVWASGYGGEILHTTNGGGITTVESAGAETPAGFELKQNYPNPFNAITKIRFGITSSGFVSLRVYDMLGREVSTLVEEHLAPGYFEARFDASRLASGIYYYRLLADGHSAVRKMLLLK